MAIAIAFGFFLLGTVAGSTEHKEMLDDVFAAVVTLFATFVGAYFAFSLQTNLEEKKKATNQRLAGDLQMFTLYRQIETLENLNSHISKIRGNPQRYVLMQPIYSIDTKNLNVDIESLSPLLTTNYKKVLFEVDL